MKKTNIINLLGSYQISDINIVKADGCYLYDENNNKYLDLESGVWCTNLGHSNKSVNDIMKNQIDKIVHLGYKFNNEAATELSSQLLKLLKFQNGKSFFLSSGSEAVNLSIQIAKNITQRDYILTLENFYLSAYGDGSYEKKNKNRKFIEMNNYESIDKIDFSNISSLVLEMGISWGRVYFPNKDFIQKLVEKAKFNGCFIIVDEVTTGFGRTGKLFGYEHYNIEPNIVALGKGLGNGYPISAVCLDNKVIQKLEEDNFIYGQSHQNDPLGCIVGLEVINQIKKLNLVQSIEKLGEYFKSRLIEITKKNDSVIEIRGRGLMIGIEFISSNVAKKIHSELFKKQIVTGLKDNILRFMPPLIIQQIDIDNLVDELGILIEDM
ncbi:MAG: aspartate aminotransferase family protein [Clostridiales bacterium]